MTADTPSPIIHTHKRQRRRRRPRSCVGLPALVPFVVTAFLSNSDQYIVDATSTTSGNRRALTHKTGPQQHPICHVCYHDEESIMDFPHSEITGYESLIGTPTCEELREAGEVYCIIPPDVCRDLPRREIQQACGCVRTNSIEADARTKTTKETKAPKTPEDEKEPKEKAPKGTKSPSKSPSPPTPKTSKGSAPTPGSYRFLLVLIVR